MKLNMARLQGLVRAEKAVVALRLEVSRVLGPIIDVDVPLRELAESVNDRLEVLERTDRMGRVSFANDVMSRFAFHADPEVRRMAARVLPESFMQRYAHDKDAGVRATVAARASVAQVKEMMRDFPHDHELRAIYARRTRQAKVLKEEAEELDINGERLGDAGKTLDLELSDCFYESLARRIWDDYGRTIDTGWEPKAVANVVRAHKQTSGVELDGERLTKELTKLRDEADERILDESVDPVHAPSLVDIVKELRGEERVDPVHDLLHARLTPETYLDEAMRVFRVQQAVLPAAIKKHRRGLGTTHVPMKARLPEGTLRPADERALDRFVEHWNARQALVGEPFRLRWDPDPSTLDGVGFSLTLS